MKYAILFLLFVSGYTNAEPKHNYHWKVFENGYGYQIKYPDCWEMFIDDPDEEGPFDTIRHISIQETAACSTKRLYEDVPNGIGISVNIEKRTPGEALKEIEIRKKRAPQNDDQPAFKCFKVEKKDAIGWVEKINFLGDLRWMIKVYCPDWWITLGGPSMDHTHVTDELRAKFKKGDLAYPEPYKTIVDSIRCIPAKKKSE